MRDPVGESVDVAVGPVGMSNLTSEPIGGDVTLSHQESIEGYGQFGMGRRRDLSIVGNLTGIPQPCDRGTIARQTANILVARRMFQDEYVLANWCTCQPLFVRCRRKRGLQGTDRGKIKISIAPLQ